MEKRDIFIGGAWPYANYYLHVGHLAALLPGDILAKYFRGKGDNVIYVSGSEFQPDAADDQSSLRWDPATQGSHLHLSERIPRYDCPAGADRHRCWNGISLRTSDPAFR